MRAVHVLLIFSVVKITVTYLQKTPSKNLKSHQVMKKLKFSLAFLFASICLLATTLSVSAERVAPTFVEHLTTTLVPGNNYYLYNVESGRFWARHTAPSNTQSLISEYGSKITITSVSDGAYHLQFADNKYYIYANQSSVSSRSSVYKDYDDFAIIADSNVIKIQRASTNKAYLETEFIGWGGTEDNLFLYPNMINGAIEWKLLPEEVGDRYFAKLQLYQALVQTDGYPYDLSKYEEIYADENSTNEDLIAASERLNVNFEFSNTIGIPEWSDYPIFFEKESGKYLNYGSQYFNKSSNIEEEICVAATFTIDKECTFVYTSYSLNNYGMYFFIEVNGEKQRNIQGNTGGKRHFIELQPGKHVVKFYLLDTALEIHDVGIEITPSMTVNLLEPGSLGTEVLYNVDHVKDVRKLKIIGEMNDDDWNKINMMTNLFSLDLSEAKITEIADEYFESTFDSKNAKFPFFHEIKLPEGLVRIGDDAFRYANIEEINFPSTLKEIGKYAFAYTRIKEAIMPDEMISIGEGAFSNIRYSLTKVNYPKNLTSISKYCFADTYNHNLKLHEGITKIYGYAFDNSYNYNPEIPSTVTYIGEYAFSNTAVDSVVLKNVSGGNLEFRAFSDCRYLKYIDFSSQYTSPDSKTLQLYSCKNLRKVILRSASVVRYNSSFPLFKEIVTDSITIVVPNYLVNSYKLNSYWYNFKIEGFDTAEVQDWTINAPVVLNARDRFNGNPNINITSGGALKINGEKTQLINNFATCTNPNTLANCGMMLSNSDSVSISGKYKHSYYVNANKWYFVSLPFNVKVSEISNAANAEFAIRRYDGTLRAESGTGSSWKNISLNDTIKAGTGFILQSNSDAWYYFPALDDESKQIVALNEDFTMPLAENPSETKANRGWNLVGNPYQCYYNIHKLNFTAPITIWNVSSKTYKAYSIIDDDVALQPNQAFFVQCPEGVNAISFPKAGRQLTSEITSQSAIVSKQQQESERKLFDIVLSSAASESDQTRVVVNAMADDSYDVMTDASKFMSMDASVPQIYTYDLEGNQYSINEGAMTRGIVKVGFYAPENGCYSISLKRATGNEIYLVDNATSTVTNLMESDYQFVAEAGIDNTRFELRFSKDTLTGIANAETSGSEILAINGGIRVSGINGEVVIYSVDGKMMNRCTLAGDTYECQLESGAYLVYANGQTVKVYVK